MTTAPRPPRSRATVFLTVASLVSRPMQGLSIATRPLVALLLGLAACGSGDAMSSASASAAASASPPPSAKVATSAEPAASAAPNVDDADVARILESAKHGKSSGALKVDLSAVDDKAPPIGGAAAQKDLAERADTLGHQIASKLLGREV